MLKCYRIDVKSSAIAAGVQETRELTVAVPGTIKMAWVESMDTRINVTLYYITGTTKFTVFVRNISTAAISEFYVSCYALY